MAADGDDVDLDVENVDETDGLYSTVIFESNHVTSAKACLSNQWLLYDDQQLLSQTWPSYSGNDDMDEESRAIIARMLKEEQRYLKPKGLTASKPKTVRPVNESGKAHIVKGFWTEEEIAGFHQGMELFGRQWSKVADHIGTRTALQVKNYAKAYLRKTTTTAEEDKPGGSDKDLHLHLPDSFKTGSPTCKSPKKITTLSSKGRPRKIPQYFQESSMASPKNKGTSKSPQPKKKTKRALSKSPNKKKDEQDDVKEQFADENVNIIEEKCEGSRVVIEEREKVHLQDASESEEDIDVELDSDEDDVDMPTVNAGIKYSIDSANDGKLLMGADTQEDVNVKYTNNLCSNRDCNEKGLDQKEADIESEGEKQKLISNSTTKISLKKMVECSNLKLKILGPQGDGVATKVVSNYDKESNRVMEQTNQLIEQPSSPESTVNSSQDYREVQYTHTDATDPALETDQGTNTRNEEVDSALCEEDSTGTDAYEPDDQIENCWKGIPKATEEVILERNVISKEEKLANPTYFIPGTSKTPLKYMMIRNKILDCWAKCKPAYLTKTAVRPSLRGCGDVNRIGAIHSALEQIGAINFGVDNPFSLVLLARHHTRNNRVNSGPHAVTLRPRSKRTCNSTAEAKEDTPSVVTKSVDRVPDKPIRKRKVAYDPFKLIQCAEFSDDKTAPFHVVISSSALVVMDLHAQLATTEIIGLLGGHYDESGGVLEIHSAKPCRSLSTGMQCEMDPVSQTEASEAIMSTGCRVVGWYHSHPTFAPNPSVRDIETQADFQAWFGPHVPYVGVIVSPYLRGLQARHAQSIFKCLTISQEYMKDSNTLKPYSFPFTVMSGLATDKIALLQTTMDLITEYAAHPHRTELLMWKWPHSPDKLYMEKVLTSIRCHLSTVPSDQPSCDSDNLAPSSILEALRSHILLVFNENSSHQAATTSTPSSDHCDLAEGVQTNLVGPACDATGESGDVDQVT